MKWFIYLFLCKMPSTKEQQYRYNKNWRTKNREYYNKSALRRYYWKKISKEFRFIGISDELEK